MKHIKLVIILFISVVFVKCTVQKRIYNKGYQVNWHKKLADSNSDDIAAKVEQKKEATIAKGFVKTEVVNLPITEMDFSPTLVKKQKTKNVLPNDSCGDVITMKNGDEITVKVIEINQHAIKYRACNNLNGPLIVIPKDNIFMIHYSNGTKEVISTEPIKDTQKQKEPARSNQEKKWNVCAIASLICFALFFLFFTAIASAILALIAQNQFEKSPDTYKGKWMIYPGLVLAGIISVLAIIFIIALLILLAAI